RGLAESEAASRLAAVNAELWPDLGRVRASLYLEIGRNSDFKNGAAKAAFQKAAAAAKQGLAASSAHPEVVAVLAQSHEALAALCRDDIEKNFAEAVGQFGQAIAQRP